MPFAMQPCCCGGGSCPAWSDDFNRSTLGSNWTVDAGTWTVAPTSLSTTSASATIRAIPASISAVPSWLHTTKPIPSKVAVSISASSGDVVTVSLNAGNLGSAPSVTWNVGTSLVVGSRTCNLAATSIDLILCLDCATESGSDSGAEITALADGVQVSVGGPNGDCHYILTGNGWTAGDTILTLATGTNSAGISFSDLALYYTNVQTQDIDNNWYGPNCRACRPCCWPEASGNLYSTLPATVTVSLSGFGTGTLLGCSNAECAALDADFILNRIPVASGLATGGACACYELDVSLCVSSGTTVTKIRFEVYPSAGGCFLKVYLTAVVSGTETEQIAWQLDLDSSSGTGCANAAVVLAYAVGGPFIGCNNYSTTTATVTP